jgi:hypothetical protein
MDRSTFRDPAVLELIEQVVPVKLDLSKMSEEEMRWYWARYPYFGLQEVDGAELYAFPGGHDGPSLRGGLESGLTRAEHVGPRLPWDDVDAFARALGDAVSAESGGRLGPAWQGYRELLGADPVTRWHQEGVAGRARVEERARADLREALAAPDAGAARERLDAARVRFEGTPYAEDFASAATIVAETGRVPVLPQEAP